MGMKRQEHTVNSKRHVSHQVLSTDCCGESTNAEATLPSCSVGSRNGEHRKIVPRTSFSTKKFWAKKLKSDWFWPVWPRPWPDPPQYPSGGVLATACRCDFRGVTFQVDLTSWLDQLSLVKWFEEGPEARVTSQLDNSNFSSWLVKFHLCSKTSVGPWVICCVQSLKCSLYKKTGAV